MFRFVRLIRTIGWISITFLGLGAFLSASFYLYLSPNLPAADQLKTTKLQTPLRIYSNDGKSIAEFGEKRRTPINLASVPQNQINAFIAAEDNRFFEHMGIDIKGLARAASQLISTGRIQSGGSTLTMQVARNFFLSREKTFIRKFNEIFLALQIEQSLSKEEILELYLNKIYLGNRAYGIEAAAQAYYGTSIQNLNLAQMAMIAGLPKAPSRYNPLANAERATIRRNWILDRMLDLNMISNDAHQTARNTPITASYHGGSSELHAPYVAEMARQEVIKLYGSDAYTIGLKVHLTIDSELQKAANNAVTKGLQNYDKRHGFRGPIKHIDLKSIQNKEVFAELRKTKSPRDHFAGVIVRLFDEEAEVLLRDGRLGTLKLEEAAWAKPYIKVDRQGKAPKALTDILSEGDVILVKENKSTQKSPLESSSTEEDDNSNTSQQPPISLALSQLPDAQSALISIKPDTGEIKALVGGYDFYMSHYNRATQAMRQPGSNFKAFVYLAALENGSTASTLINDAPIVFEDKNLEAAWRPENSSGKFYGPTRIRKALYNSRNLVSIRLLKETGVRKTLDTIERFDFDRNKLPKDLSLALGSAALPPIEIASGYAMIANGGYKINTHLISHIEDGQGNIVYQANHPTVCHDKCEEQVTSAPTLASNDKALETTPPKAERIADQRSIFILHSMLKDVITKGTGRRALTLKRNDLAGKTGTTNDQKDAWFSGFNTQLATSVWVGFDQPKTLGRREYGSRAALPIWIDYMATALQDTPEGNMKRPKGLVTVRIDKETGELTQPGSPNSMFETYRQEYAPKQKQNINNRNDDTGINKSPILVEDIF